MYADARERLKHWPHPGPAEIADPSGLWWSEIGNGREAGGRSGRGRTGAFGERYCGVVGRVPPTAATMVPRGRVSALGLVPVPPFSLPLSRLLPSAPLETASPRSGCKRTWRHSRSAGGRSVSKTRSRAAGSGSCLATMRQRSLGTRGVRRHARRTRRDGGASDTGRVECWRRKRARKRQRH